MITNSQATSIPDTNIIRRINYSTSSFNLENAQDIYFILRDCGLENKTIVLEDFNHISEETKAIFAFGLKLFYELRIRMILVDVSKESNFLFQYNGDLLGRIKEITVDPWLRQDLVKVIDLGSSLLNVSFDQIKEVIIDATFGSIGVLQELCRLTCEAANVREYQPNTIILLQEHLDHAIWLLQLEFGSRHNTSLKNFALRKQKTSDKTPLYLSYYLTRLILQTLPKQLLAGLQRSVIITEIKKVHHDPERITASSIDHLLKNLIYNQIRKVIIPPLFDIDSNHRLLKVTDSTFLFFLANADVDSILEGLTNPLEDFDEDDYWYPLSLKL